MNSLRTNLGFVLALCSAPVWAHHESGANAAATSADAAAVTSMTYQCAGGKKIVAVIDTTHADKPTTTISVEGDAALQNIALHEVVSANGVKTSNDKLVWWTKGDEGFLAEVEPPLGSGEVLIGDCKEVPAT